MSLWKVAWRSILQRSVGSALTIASMGLGVALVVAVIVVYEVVSQSFNRGGEGYDLIVGAKGSKEQLVLNSVFYLGRPLGNIPYSVYEELHEGKYMSDVSIAVPICMGNMYQGCRVIGTSPDMFDLLTYRDNQPYEFAEGENFKAGNTFDAVLGAAAAAKTGLRVGPKEFQPLRGMSFGDKQFQHWFNVVGILKPTGTPIDRAVFVNMESFFLTQPNAPSEKRETAEGEESHKEITAVLVCVPPFPPGRADILAKQINSGPVAQAVAPVRVISDLFEGIVGKVQWILLGMAVLTVIEAGIGIMVSIYNSMSDRRHEIAIMRALGASRMTVMCIILMESILLSLFGGALGLLIGHGATWAFSPWIAEWTGVSVGWMQVQWMELILIPGLIALASLVGFLPAMAAYRTDVAKSLITTP